jgi:CMP-N,N'-diacetyllegionaminic acid synthase
MLNNKKFLAVIPARGGSKRLSGKNILDLAGKPLIAWTIEAAKESQYIDAVLVTSDSDEIIEVAKSFAAETVKRPAHLADDTATTFDAIEHAIKDKGEYDYIVLLQPTSPLRAGLHIDEAIALLDQKNADAVISVTELEHSLQWVNGLPEDDSMAGFLKDEYINKRSQDFERHYRLNGAIYICRKERLLLEKTFFIKDKIFAYKMDQKASVDIDEEMDFKWACFLLNQA